MNSDLHLFRMGLLSFIKGLLDNDHNTQPRAKFNLERFVHLKRDCWIPESAFGEDDPTASKFGGTPYLPEGECWPECPNCNNPMQLFVQLNPDSMPEPTRNLWGSGLLQFFYCTNYEPCCEADCSAWDAHSKSTLLRIVQKNGPAAMPKSSPLDVFPAKTIFDWNRRTEYPNWEEVTDLTGDRDDPAYEDWEEVQEYNLFVGEKLLGWPCWVQGVEYPNCRECGKRMEMLFQIDSEVNIPYMFGDAGCGHITQCPEHKTELAFRWACS